MDIKEELVRKLKSGKVQLFYDCKEDSEHDLERLLKHTFPDAINGHRNGDLYVASDPNTHEETYRWSHAPIPLLDITPIKDFFTSYRDSLLALMAHSNTPIELREVLEAEMERVG